MSDDTPKGPPENLQAVDPLGEIRNYALELYNNAGSPEDKSWEDYWEAAEETILGKGRESASAEHAKKSQNQEPRRIPEALEETMNTTENSTHRVLIASLRRNLNEHECVCLDHILGNHCIVFENEEEIKPLTLEQRAEVLALLAGEYDASFFESVGNDNILTIPLKEKMEYWKKRLELIAENDEPLQSNDRNTIQRLADEIAAEPSVRVLRFVAPAPTLA